MDQKYQLVSFDLDGVLIDLCDLHRNAFNFSLKKLAGFELSEKEHLERFDGLSSIDKATILSSEGKLDSSLIRLIDTLKNETFNEMLSSSNLKINDDLIDLILSLKQSNKTVVLVSNARAETVQNILKSSGDKKLFDFWLSNDNVFKRKPDANPYEAVLAMTKVDPKAALLIEDSPKGRASARASGADLLPIMRQNDVVYDVKKFLETGRYRLNVVIPMAGEGKRFLEKGIVEPKPFIQLSDRYMIEHVLSQLPLEANYIFICKSDHLTRDRKYKLHELRPNATIVEINKTTTGAAQTVCLAQSFIERNESLLISNCDQHVEWDSDMFFRKMLNFDGGLLTFKEEEKSPKWSYAAVENDLVTKVAEKDPISENASVGMYYWRDAQDYFDSVKQMVDANDRTNGEFYVCPTYNWAIKSGKKVGYSHCDLFLSLGTPEDLENFYLKKKLT